MIIIPQKLFEDSRINVIFRDGNVCILKKELTTPVMNREGYISNHVISVLLEGRQQINTHDGQSINVNSHEVLVVPRGVYHITDLIPEGGSFRSLLFYFDDAIVQEFLSTSKATRLSKSVVPDYLKLNMVPSIKLFAESLIDIYQAGHLHDKEFLNLKILELLYLLSNTAREQQLSNFLFNLTLPKRRNIKSFMAKNFNKPLKIEDYAYLTGRSLSTFRRDFKAYYDITPQKWLKEKRLDKALELLNKQEIGVTQLAYDVGYENVSYFIKAFKEKTGISPKQYTLALHRNKIRQ